MIPEIGQFALILAFATAVYQFAVPMYGAWRGDHRLMAVAPSAAMLQVSLIAIAFAALTWCYITSDFSVENVYRNSHSDKPLIYKISGVWGNHEGSMVLWVLILAIFGSAVAAFGGNLPPSLKARVISVQGSISVAFLLFILLTSNPFNRLDPAPIEGRGLNPILQDPAGHSSAASLRRLCWPLDRLFLCRRRPDRRQGRCGLGTLGPAVDAGSLDVPHRRHHARFLVGLLRARLGRLVVLGSGGKCLLHALAYCNSAAALGHRRGKAQRA
jgi:hypothetical protein